MERDRIMTEGNIMGRTKLETLYKWKKNNLKRYEFALNKVTNKIAYEHLEKQENKRAYLIKLIEDDAKK